MSSRSDYGGFIDDTIDGAGKGALIGLAFGNPGRGALYGSVLGALGVSRRLFRGGSKGRGNVFNEMYTEKHRHKSRTGRVRRTRMRGRRSGIANTTMMALLNDVSPRGHRSRSRSRSRSMFRSRSRSPRRRSRSRSRSKSAPRLTSRERQEATRKYLEEEAKNLEYRRKNAYKLSPGVPFPE
jgi:hypothetical protein